MKKIKFTIQIIKKNNTGFVLLFAIILSSIILAIALGVSNITLKELTFSTSGVATNDAFFASDTGEECALDNDKASGTNFPIIVDPAVPPTSITCANKSIPLSFSGTPTTANYSFIVTGLGSSSQSCVKINVFKDNSAPPMKTSIIAKGYNIGDSSCNSTNTNRVERELHVDY